jgi:hypothetical protein
MSNSSNSNLSRTVTLTLESGDYTMSDEENRFVSIVMEGFGTEVAPGKPQLPGRTFHVEIPKGAIVQSVDVVDSETSELNDSFRIMPARAVVHDRPGHVARKN